MLKIQYIKSLGKKLAKILLPSSGGMGIRLKVPKTIFNTITWPKIGAEMLLTKPNLMGITHKAANKKLLNGPANATSAIPSFCGFKLLKSTGTGLAAPKIIGDPIAKSIKGKSIEPKGSM